MSGASLLLRPVIPTRQEVEIACAVAALVGVLAFLGWLRPLERPVGDALLRVVHTWARASSSVVAVVIDDRSVEELGPMPRSRLDLARLLDRIDEHQPRAVVVDILLSEPRDEEGDAALERALRGAPVVLVAGLSPQGDWLLPLDRFGGAAVAAHGHAEMDSDGVVRSIAATKQARNLSLPALALAAARLAGWDGPLRPGGRVWPDYRQAPEEIPRLSAVDLLDGSTQGHAGLAGSLVFLGVSASGASDQYLVPVGSRNIPMPGVLVHAAVASAVLRGSELRQSPVGVTAALLLLASLAPQLLRRWGGRLRIARIGVLLAVVVGMAVAALALGDLVLPTVALTVSVVLAAGAREAVESRQAQAQTGTILSSLVQEEGSQELPALPTGVQDRLALVRQLQHRLARDRDRHRTLLEGMNEGVVLWDGRGEPVLANSAWQTLWGAPPSLPELRVALGEPEQRDDSSTLVELERGGRQLEVEVLPLADGRLGLLRDVSRHHELERRRREMHRLVSHELKTPLASLAGFGEMLQTYELSADELQRVAGMIRNEADRLGEMVQRFLELERLGAGAGEVEWTEVDLAALVTQRLEVLRSAASARSQRITVLGDKVAPMVGAAPLLSRLVDNLVGNALKYSPEGGEIRVEVRTGEEGEVVVQVRDQGVGIPEEAVPQLFERFYRVPGTTAPGSGLGLALVKEVAELHGATIEVESEHGTGSCFTVVFPAAGASS